ncbi:MAG: response regulator [Bacteroidia bacterium]
MNYLYPIRIVLSDNFYFRKGLVSMLKNTHSREISIVAEADNGNELLEAVNNYQTDLVITDVKMPGMCALEVIKTIVQNFPSIGIIAMSVSLEKNQMISAYEAGAKAYVSKYAEHHEILEAIQKVYQGESYYNDHTLSIIAHLFQLQKKEKQKYNKPPLFNNKEREIITLICKEYTTKEIANKLGISTRTIDDYRYKIQEKMEAKNMVGIALFAIKNKLISIEELK